MSPPLRVLVLEDEWPARNYLVKLVEGTGAAHVVAAVPSTALATEALRASPAPIDVAFVDVHLAEEQAPSRAGLRWIEAVARSGEGRRPPLIVLTTATNEHALRAFELGVVDYLLKPFTERRVRATLERVLLLVPAAAPAPPEGELRIAARDGRAIVFLEREEVFAFEAEGRLCYVHTARGRLDVDLSLTALEAVLGPRFLRVHRTWLVSLPHVRAIERDSGEHAVLVGPSASPLRVPVARDRIAAVRERLLATSVGLRRES